jgi:hypothetical protein
MLVPQAMIELSRMPGDVAIPDLTDRFNLVASRSPALRSELEVTLAGGVQLPSMLKSEPLRAWAGTKRGRGSDWFRIRSDRFEAVLIQAMRDEAYNVREQAMAYLRTLATPAAPKASFINIKTFNLNNSIAAPTVIRKQDDPDFRHKRRAKHGQY